MSILATVKISIQLNRAPLLQFIETVGADRCEEKRNRKLWKIIYTRKVSSWATNSRSKPDITFQYVINKRRLTCQHYWLLWIVYNLIITFNYQSERRSLWRGFYQVSVQIKAHWQPSEQDFHIELLFSYSAFLKNVIWHFFFSNFDFEHI